ncbi:MAG: AbrB/MazE/SpoVT family DNA-binding domain-containing protein [Anaerolineales bacterium]|nr:AbrB/MazE/SpoVT family DNA-binding domain-containing protein [Anaerolineales bacterium]
MLAISVKVSKKNQIALPRSVHEELNIKAGDHLLMDVQDGVMILIPSPKRYANCLQELHPEIWKSLESTLPIPFCDQFPIVCANISLK